MLSACGIEKREEIIDFVPPPDSFFNSILNGSPDIADEELEAIGKFQVKHLPGFNPERVYLFVVDTTEESGEYCLGAWACTYVVGGLSKVMVPWDLTLSNWPVNKSAVKVSAQTIAHEFCHAYYYQDGGDGDPLHSHQECFGDDGGNYGGSDPNNPTVVVRVAQDFVQAYADKILAERKQ